MIILSIFKSISSPSGTAVKHTREETYGAVQTDVVGLLVDMEMHTYMRFCLRYVCLCFNCYLRVHMCRYTQSYILSILRLCCLLREWWCHSACAPSHRRCYGLSQSTLVSRYEFNFTNTKRTHTPVIHRAYLMKTHSRLHVHSHFQIVQYSYLLLCLC